MCVHISGLPKPPYKTFFCLIDQLDVDKPNLTILQNELGVTPVADRFSQGWYYLDFGAPVLTSGKTSITFGQTSTDAGTGNQPIIIFHDPTQSTDTIISFLTMQLDTPLDSSSETGMISATPTTLEVRVYN